MYAYRACRRAWRDRKCGGILVWQINDCWPTTSWAIVDYYRRKKPAYYSTGRMIKPLAIGVSRAHHSWTQCHARPPKKLPFDVWVSSSLLQAVTADVEVRFVSVRTGEEIKGKVVKRNVNVSANSSTPIMTGEIDYTVDEPYCVAVTLTSRGQIVSRDVDWPQPFKYLSFECRGVEVRIMGDTLLVRVARPVKGLCFELEDGINPSDNCIDVMPGDDQTIHLTGAGENFAGPVAWQYLGQEQS